MASGTVADVTFRPSCRSPTPPRPSLLLVQCLSCLVFLSDVTFALEQAASNKVCCHTPRSVLFGVPITCWTLPPRISRPGPPQDTPRVCLALPPSYPSFGGLARWSGASSSTGGDAFPFTMQHHSLSP